ncbi:hypothetical protein ACWET9_36115 [Streptomyces sp. NPDC004059]
MTHPQPSRPPSPLPPTRPSGTAKPAVDAAEAIVGHAGAAPERRHEPSTTPASHEEPS